MGQVFFCQPTTDLGWEPFWENESGEWTFEW